MTTQPGIFGLGTAEHCYLEVDLRPGHSIGELAAADALGDPLSTTGGVNLVVGFRPELWAQLAPGHASEGLTGFNDDVVGPDGFRMPATQHDAWLWIAGGDRTAVFDNTLTVIRGLARIASIGTEVTGWLYQHDRDLTERVRGAHRRGAGTGDGAAASRTASSLTTPSLPTAHVARTALEGDGEELPIFRRNTAYGTATDHGTLFVGFSQDQRRLVAMLERMAGSSDGIRDALTARPGLPAARLPPLRRVMSTASTNRAQAKCVRGRSCSTPSRTSSPSAVDQYARCPCTGSASGCPTAAVGPVSSWLSYKAER